MTTRMAGIYGLDHLPLVQEIMRELHLADMITESLVTSVMRDSG